MTTWVSSRPNGGSIVFVDKIAGLHLNIGKAFIPTLISAQLQNTVPLTVCS